jgi:multicomponent Na+:H+ antiporter subunit G
MDLVLDVLSIACLLIGSAFAVIGGVGIVRLPDFFARIHGAGITDTLGAGFILLGLMFQAGLTLILVKLLLIWFFLFITSPTSTHALAKSALTHGVEPELAETGDVPFLG